VGKKRFKSDAPLPPGQSYKNAPKAPVFHDTTPKREWDLWFNPVVNGEVKAHGAVPRDFHKHPREMFAPPSDLKLVPKGEWSERCKQKSAEKSWLTQVRDTADNGKPVPSLDQDGVGYCWAHSSTQAVMLSRMARNDPYVPLSAFHVAATIKNGADEGGWCGLSAKFIRETGVCAQSIWPQGDRNVSKYKGKPEVNQNAALHKITGDWVDLTRDVYDVALTFEQLATLLLDDIPCPVDMNWWSHSICAIELVETSAGSFGIRILNSWSDSWGERGTGILEGRKAIPDSALGVRLTGAGPG
jgi:C1A family cysteine protease